MIDFLCAFAESVYGVLDPCQRVPELAPLRLHGSEQLVAFKGRLAISLLGFAMRVFQGFADIVEYVANGCIAVARNARDRVDRFQPRGRQRW